MFPPKKCHNDPHSFSLSCDIFTLCGPLRRSHVHVEVHIHVLWHHLCVSSLQFLKHSVAIPLFKCSEDSLILVDSCIFELKRALEQNGMNQQLFCFINILLLLKCENFLFFFVLFDSKLNVLVFGRTRQVYLISINEEKNL